MDADAPFRIEGPAVITFSGGRTSGYLLWQILQAHGGSLPCDVKVSFQNTGREHRATYDFIRECERRWGVAIRWLEYARRPGPVTTNGRTIDCHSWREVQPQHASTKGEPFEELLRVFAEFRKVAKDSPPVLPNPVQRFCTGILKQRVMHWWVTESLGWDDEYTVTVGLRADEPKRVANLTAAYVAMQPVAPLAKAGKTLDDVMAFWKAQPFDLQLPHDPKLGTYQGNCDFCFLKSNDKIKQAYRDDPDAAKWWADQEQWTGQKFRKDRFSMTDLVAGRVPLETVNDDDDLGTCFCTD